MNESYNSLWLKIRIPVVIGVLALVPPLVFDPGATAQSTVIIQILSFMVLALGLNIAFGHTDQLFLFAGALAGIGAYGTALTADWLGISPWFTILIGAISAGVVGAIVSYVAARRRFTIMLIAILTLALQLAFIQLLIGASHITGGNQGFRPWGGLPTGSIEAILGVSSQAALYYLVLGVLAITMVVYHLLTTSKFGMAFDAIRQDEVAAESVGVDVVRHKTLAGFVTALLIGFLGPFYASTERILIPSLFDFVSIDVLVLIILVLGGVRTMMGAIIGAPLIIFIHHELRGLPEVALPLIGSVNLGQYRTALFGLLLMGLFLYFRQGVVPNAQQVFQRLSKIGPTPSEES